SRTTSFTVGGAEGYMTSGAHDDGELGEVFLKLGKQGSTLAGVMDAFSIAVSIGLQYGVPLETYVSKFTNLSFEPAGLTDDADVLEQITGTAVDSPLCMTCGTKMRPAGSCYVCEGCGSTSGCS